MNTHTLYLVLGGSRHGYTKIVAVRRRKPKHVDPTKQAVVAIEVSTPNYIGALLAPPSCHVEIKPERFSRPKITATPTTH